MSSDPAVNAILVYLGVMTMALAYGLLYAGLRTCDRQLRRSPPSSSRSRPPWSRRCPRRAARRPRRGRTLLILAAVAGRWRGGAGLGAAARVTFQAIRPFPRAWNVIDTRPAEHRLVCAGVLGVALIVGAIALPSTPRAISRARGSRGWRRSRRSSSEARPHVDPPGTPPHNHNDPKTKNLVSRAGETGPDVRTRAPSSPAPERGVRRRRAAAAGPDADARDGAMQRGSAPAGPLRDGERLLHGSPRGGEPLFFKPTRLGHLPALRRLAPLRQRRRRQGHRAPARTPSGRRGRGTAAASRSPAATPALVQRRHHRVPPRRGPPAARPYPEAQIDVSGDPHAGVTPYQEVRGYVDAHTHGMAFEFLGGDVHCGKPWDRYGAPYALVDCPDHSASDGYGGVARGRAVRAARTTTRSAGRRSRTGRRRTR